MSNLLVSDFSRQVMQYSHHQSSIRSHLAIVPVPVNTQTLAPLVGTWLISQQVSGYIFSSDALFDTEHTQTQSADVDQDALRHALFILLVYVPIACSVIQLYCWSKFSLHGGYLKQVQIVIGWIFFDEGGGEGGGGGGVWWYVARFGVLSPMEHN